MAMSGDCSRVSRPNSLVLETIPPEKQPLHFDVQLVGAPPEVEQLVNNIKQVAEEFLYHWKTFPIVLPPSRFCGAGNRLSDIIVAPPCDELDAAMDAGLEPQPLTPKQLHSLREKGEFEVPSRHFPGQTQVWRVAGWLQRGTQRTREELHTNVARAAALITVVSRDRLTKDCPLSAVAGARALINGMHRLLDILIGMPSLAARDLERKIKEERSRYLVAELICKPEHQEDISILAAWVGRAMKRAASEKTRDSGRIAPPVPCVYTTPQKMQVDLRLYKRDILRRAANHLQAILERESRGWFLHFRERRAALLATQKMPIKDIEEDVRNEAMREYVTRVCAAVEKSEEIAALGQGVSDLLAQQLRASVLVYRADEGVTRKLETGLEAAEVRIRAAHPILSKADNWRKEKLSVAAQKLNSELRWAPMEDAAAAMQAHKLNQHRYFLLRDLAFLRDREPLLMKELRAAKSPTREFTWATRIWLPQNWIIIRHFRGKSERIPTVISTRATSIVTPRSDPSQPVFLVEKEKIRTTSTRWPGWRLINLAHRSWCWSWSVMFVLAVVVPWWSPISLRALTPTPPFVPDHELSQVNGTLFPKRSSETPTMWSRLLSLWRHVSKERTRFETEPDTGLFGKGLSRQANRLWNYGVVGGLGSLALLLVFPIGALICSTLSLLLAITVPLWVPPLAILLHVSNAVVYDLDCPDPKNLNRVAVLFEVVVWRILTLGVLQWLAAIFVAIVLCPLGAALLALGGALWWCMVSGWQWLVWRFVVFVGARVPARDSAYCRRRSALTTQRPHYRIQAAQALAAVCARAEQDSLTQWAAETEKEIERPLQDYKHFVTACFAPFSLQINKTGPYRQLEKECAALIASLRDKVSARKKELALGLSDTVRTRVRMTSQDLRRAVQTSALELAHHCTRGSQTDGWWPTAGLDQADWHAAAANTLQEVFDSEILVALEETEPHILVDSGSGLAQWTARCGHSAPPDVLVRDVRTHSGVWGEWCGTPAPRVPPPALELGAFSPRAPHHPPVPHPATVALVLHNRESDNPVPLDSELCAEVIKTLEDAPDCDDKRGVERCRGGGSEVSSGNTSDYTADDDEIKVAKDDVESGMCRISPQAERAACRWTLTGRGVRLRADLASPEDVTLDERQGTSV